MPAFIAVFGSRQFAGDSERLPSITLQHFAQMRIECASARVAAMVPLRLACERYYSSIRRVGHYATENLIDL